MVEFPAARLADFGGIGVAGNFAGHLEQAGEAADFVGVDAPGQWPMGIFPWYLPGAGSFLVTFPVSSERLAIEASELAPSVQIEPEVGVVFAAEYAGGKLCGLHPQLLGAFNDCSIRRPGARLISEKKNWGEASKGFASRLFPVSEISRAGAAHLRIACFLRREGACSEYGIDSPVADYSCFGEELLGWLVDRLQNQRGGEGPLEDVGAMLARSGSPRNLLVGIGATRYTELGEHTYLQPGDDSIVIVYDESVSSRGQMTAAVAAGREQALAGASVLSQRVVATAKTPWGATDPT